MADEFNGHTYSNAAPLPPPTLADLARCREAIDALGPSPKFTGRIFIEDALPRLTEGKLTHWELNDRGDVLISKAMQGELKRRFG